MANPSCALNHSLESSRTLPTWQNRISSYQAQCISLLGGLGAVGHLTSIMVLCSVGLVSAFEHTRLVLALGTFLQLSYQFGTWYCIQGSFWPGIYGRYKPGISSGVRLVYTIYRSCAGMNFWTYQTGPGIRCSRLFFFSYPAGTGEGYFKKNFHTSLVLENLAPRLFLAWYKAGINLVLV